MVVRATDGTNSADVSVVVNVQPVNEDTPSYSTNPSLPFSETIATGTLLTTYAATDTDDSTQAHGLLAYSMTGGQ